MTHVHGPECDSNMADTPPTLSEGLASLMEDMEGAAAVLEGLPEEMATVIGTMLNLCAVSGYIHGVEVGIPHQLHAQRIAAWESHEKGLSPEEGAEVLNASIEAVFAEFTMIKATADVNAAMAMGTAFGDIGD